MKALIVDDDRVLADVVAFALRREGFQVIQAYDGVAALQYWAEEKPDLIVLDVDLPKIDGFSVCHRIRKQADTPIMILTACTGEEDIIRGLELGADVYMTKPFSPRQLVARARALLRRVAPSTASQPGKRRQASNSHPLYPVSQQGPRNRLSPLEQRLFDYMQTNAGKVLPSERLIAHVWGPYAGDLDMLRHLVRRLRGKIELDPAHPVLLRTFPGKGYALVEERE